MATYSSYPQVDYTNDLKLLAGDPSRSELVRVSGQSLFDYLNENLDQFDEALLGFTTTDVAVNEDLPIGKIIYTTGGSVVDDGNGGPFLVVAAGEGDIPMFNGNELLRLPFGSLSGSDATDALVTTLGGTSTVSEALSDRALSVSTIAEMKALQPEAGDSVILTQNGRAGKFVFRSGNQEANVSLDPQNGIWVAPNSSPSGASGAWVRLYDGVSPNARLNVCWFGADPGNSAAANVTAFNAASDYGLSLYVPGGQYNLNGTWALGGGAVNIAGDGRGLTVLVFTGASIGIDVDNTGVFSPVDISAMSITTNDTTPTGTAVNIEWPETFDGRNIHKGTLRELQIEGLDNVNNGWLKGVRYLQAAQVAIDNCGILGKDGGGTSTNAQAQKTQSERGIEFVGGVFPVEIRVDSSLIACFDYGFYAEGAPEGLYFNSSVFLSCRIGIYAVPTVFSPGIGGGSAAFRPLLFIANSHVSTYQSCVYSDGMIQSSIHDNLFYIQDGGAQPATMLDIRKAGSFKIHDNQFFQFASAELVNGATFDTTSDAEFYNNEFGNMNRGLWIKPTSTNVNYRGNKFGNTYPLGAVFNESATSWAGTKGAFVYLSADGSIPNGVNTEVAFNVENYDYGGWYGVGNAFTVPIGETRIKLKANIKFGPNGTGMRRVEIRKNGNAIYNGAANRTENGSAAHETDISVETPLLKVATADVFTVVVFQDSGAALPVYGLGRSWFSVESAG